jgi:hypothetical protein
MDNFDWEYWSGKLSEVIQEIVNSAETDEETGELVLSGPWGTDPSIDEERFQTIDDVKDFLCRIGFEETSDGFKLQAERPMISLDPYEIEYFVDDSRLQDLAQKIQLPDPENRIFTFRDYCENTLIVPASIELSAANEELIRYLSKHPKLLFKLDPRKFEELVSEIFKDMGFETIVTPRTRDGGNDIRAVKKDGLGTFLYLIECKRYAPHRPVGVEVIRSLYGVSMAEQATYGIVATTSHFSKDAKEFAKKVQYQLSLRDYSDLQRWLLNYGHQRGI